MIYIISQSEYDAINAELNENQAFGYESDGKYLFNLEDVVLYDYDVNLPILVATGKSLGDFLSDKEVYKTEPDTVKIYNTEVDSEGRQIVRRATAKKGWHYSAITTEITTSSTTVYNKDYLGNDLNQVSVVMYDAEDNVTTDSAQCVKTIATITPDYDYEIIEGDIYHKERPSSPVRMWTLAGAPSLGPAGVAVFVNGLNLEYMSPDDHIESDGRSSKFMKQFIELDLGAGPVQIPSNSFQFILKHEPGYQHGIMILLELYRS